MRTALPIHPTMRHPLTGAPLRAVYVSRRGQVYWPVIGGSGEGEGTGGDGGDQGDGGKAKEPNIEGAFDEERAKRTIAAARASEAKAKEAAKAAQDRANAILKAAGLTEDGKADPEAAVTKATQERDAAMQKARDNAVQLTVYRSAGKAGADPDALLDSRGFAQAVKDLDPDAADFGDKVTEAIKAALKANPKLAAATGTQGGQGPARQGADHTGGSGSKSRPTSLGAAVTAALGDSK